MQKHRTRREEGRHRRIETSFRARLGALVGLELALLVLLHALSQLDTFAVDWADLSGWLSDAAFEDAFGAMVLLIALGLAYWLLLSTLAYLLASLAGRPALVGAVRRLTLPPIRRLVSRAVALSLAASAVAGPLVPAVANLAGGGSPAAVVVPAVHARRLDPPGTDDAPAPGDEPLDMIVPPHLGAPPGTEPGNDGAGTEVPASPSPDGGVVHTVTVRRGDHLWSISERHLKRLRGRTPLGEHEIARYWVRVIEANRSSIRSGDPDLIYPGEVITLPIVDAGP